MSKKSKKAQKLPGNIGAEATGKLAAATGGRGPSVLLQVLEASPDGLVVTTLQGNILTVNRAFLDFVQLATLEEVRGQPLDRWLGRRGVDVRVLIGNLRRHASVRLYLTTLRGEGGALCDVEVVAVSAVSVAERYLGFILRNVTELTDGSKTSAELPRSAEELTALIGQIPLREIVRDTTAIIERRCIEAALRLTGDNRATAAALLGLSRQSLYVKLRRHGLGGLGQDAG